MDENERYRTTIVRRTAEQFGNERVEINRDEIEKVVAAIVRVRRLDVERFRSLKVAETQ